MSPSRPASPSQHRRRPFQPVRPAIPPENNPVRPSDHLALLRTLRQGDPASLSVFGPPRSPIDDGGGSGGRCLRRRGRLTDEWEGLSCRVREWRSSSSSSDLLVDRPIAAAAAAASVGTQLLLLLSHHAVLCLMSLMFRVSRAAGTVAARFGRTVAARAKRAMK